MTSKWRPVVRENSRAGCTKCKERRIKCDRNAPACRNCVARNYVCPGYTLRLQWKGKHQLSQSPNAEHDGSANPHSYRPLPVPMSILVTDSPLTQRLFITIPGDRQWRDPERRGTNESFCEDKSNIGEKVSLKPNLPEFHAGSPSSGAEVVSIAATIPLIADSAQVSNYGSMRQCPLDLLTLMEDKHISLVRHYFQSVCVINSCYDSFANPLRTGIKDAISSSRLIYFCILSMSAAHLRRMNTQWSVYSLEYMTRALSVLSKQLAELLTESSALEYKEQKQDEVLLAIIMLGMSTSWHVTSGLGLEHIGGSRALLKRWVYRQSGQDQIPSWPKMNFYLGLQAYWEAVASFLIDQDIDWLEHLYHTCMTLPKHTIHIHPWAGISSAVWVLLAKAGCIARKKRYYLLEGQTSLKSTSEVNRNSPWSDLKAQAEVLEEQLLDYSIPDIAQIEPTHDEKTPVNHLEDIAHCCKLAALLELYRAFGTLCEGHIALKLLKITRGKASYRGFNLKDSSPPPICTTIVGTLSLEILRILKSIPMDSHTRCLHPILLLIAGSALLSPIIIRRQQRSQHRYSNQSHNLTAADVNTSVRRATQNLDSTAIYDQPAVESTSAQSPRVELDLIHIWRRFVYDRITHIEEIINLDNIRKVRTILLSVWERDDQLVSSAPDTDDMISTEPVHWIDIMEEQDLRILF